MSGIAILAVIGLVMWCGALTRRLADNGAGSGCLPGDGQSSREIESQLADLSDAYQRLELDMAARVTELEERQDFTERMLAREKERVQLSRGA